MKPFQAVFEVFLVSLKLGLTSFGGPIAHLGYFHKEYVTRKKWIDEQNYLDLVALCQVLPGPASSQLGISIGTLRAGIAGGIVAWVGFTLPSALVLTLFAVSLGVFELSSSPWIHGLKLVALAVVFQAVISMWKKLIVSKTLGTIALATMVFVLFWNSGLSQMVALVAAAAFGALRGELKESEPRSLAKIPYSKAWGLFCLVLFALLLITLPIFNSTMHNSLLALADGFYRSSSLVFGGGHVILPLLEKEFVSSGLVSKETFLAGYGAAQAVPGPLFTFSAYLGASVAGVPGAIVGLLAIFLPAYLLVIGILPFWDSLRRNGRILRSLSSINAAVVGILMAALYNPLWTTSIQRPIDLCVAVVLVLILMVWELPPLVAVLVGIVGCLGLNLVGVF